VLHSSFLMRWLGMRGRVYKVKNFRTTHMGNGNLSKIFIYINAFQL